VLQEGGADDAPPPAEESEVIVAAGLCRFAEPALPPGAVRQNEAALGFALEEGLLNPPEENRYCLQGCHGIDRVGVIARSTLLPALDWLSGHGLGATRILPEESGLPAPPAGGWTVASLARGWALRLDSGRALCVPLFGDALWRGLRAWSPPSQLLVCGDRPLPAVLHDLPKTSQPALDWRLDAMEGAHDFAAARTRWRRIGRRWRQAARQAVLALLALALLDLTVQLGELGWLHWQQWRLTVGLTEAARGMGMRPSTDAGVLNQARQYVAAARARRGLAADGDLLPMLAALQPLLTDNAGLRRLHYRQGELSVEGDALPAVVSPTRQRLLSAGGWVVAAAPGRLTLTFAPVVRLEAQP
jgi:type II secretion system protein L